MTRHSSHIGISSELLYIGDDMQLNTLTGRYTYLFGGGYCEFRSEVANADSIQYFYYTKDHLGNVRNVLTKNDYGQMEELQQTHYYPFGGIIADLSSGRDVQNRLYNGKELDTSNNLWWYDYVTRPYDPTRGQFTTPDPLAEKYYPWNYYTYCVNNPLKFIDPDGREIVLVGTYKEQYQLLCLLQQLTNDRIGFVNKTGKVVIMPGGKGMANNDNDYSVGTALIQGLISDDNKMVIQMGSNACEKDYSPHENAFNGKGTDTRVFFNTEADVYVEDINGKQFVEKCPPAIILAHEMIHGYRSMNGIAKSLDKTASHTWENKKNGKTYCVTGKREELETIGLVVSTCNFTENKIRKEHGLNKRVRYSIPGK